MLTESEKKWLEDRRHKAYCRYCNVSKLCANLFASGYSCPLKGNMKDALEFSERVAALLANEDIRTTTWMLEAERSGQSDGWARLKIARLAVEQEMDGC